MKILHVAYIYPPGLDIADGITTVVHNVTKELAKRGHEVAVFTSNMLDLHSNGSLRSGNSTLYGVDVHYSRSVGRSKAFIITPDLISTLSKKLRSYDVIHIHDCRSFQGINTFLFSRMKKVPYVFQPHGSYLSSSQGSIYKTLVKRSLDLLISDRIVRHASRVIALNQVESEELQRFGLPCDKIITVPNGIDLSEYSCLPSRGSFRKKFGIKEKAKVALYLGRIHETKGIEVLIKAYAHLVDILKFHNTILVLAGPDDGYLNSAKSLVCSLGVSNSVLFTGFIDRKDKLGALLDADLFVTPAFQGFPMTFLEACIVGTPILTTTMGDQLDWIDGKVGYITSPEERDLASAMRNLFSDDSLCSEFSKNCLNLIKSRFSLNAVVDKLELIYQEVIGEKTQFI